MIDHLPVAGRKVLVHTSLKAIGDVRAENYVADWRRAVGEAGIVMFPTHTGVPEISPSNPPSFDVRSSPAVRIGITPEVARQTPGGYRSLHATHSVVGFGKEASGFLASHFDSYTPCDRLSPYYKLVEEGGLIALVGCDHSNNTCLHMIEEIAEVDYHLLPGEGVSSVVDADGNALRQRSRYHSWQQPRNFNRVDALLDNAGAQTRFAVGNAEVRLVEASAFYEVVLPLVIADNRFLCRDA